VWQHHTHALSGDVGADENSKPPHRLRNVVGTRAFPTLHTDDVFLVPTGIPRTTQKIEGAFSSNRSWLTRCIQQVGATLSDINLRCKGGVYCPRDFPKSSQLQGDPLAEWFRGTNRLDTIDVAFVGRGKTDDSGHRENWRLTYLPHLRNIFRPSQ
jgi:hypothetical protein